MFTLLDLCVSSLRRGHANLLCIVPILSDDPRRESGDIASVQFETKLPQNNEFLSVIDGRSTLVFEADTSEHFEDRQASRHKRTDGILAD